MVTKLPLIAANEIFNKPIFCSEAYIETVLHTLGGRISVDSSNLNVGEDFTARGGSADSGSESFHHIEVLGSLTHRASYLNAASGMQSYQDLSRMVGEFADDQSSKVLVMEIDSPGGAVSGVFDLADKIRSVRESQPNKKIISVVNDVAASAAYLIASQANHIVATQTASIGSIGAVVVHMDHSQRLENEGIKPTIIRSSPKKMAGSSLEALSEEVSEDIQQRINSARDLFVDAVVKGRMGANENFNAEDFEKMVRGTEAGMFSAKDALEMGLIDDIMSAEKAFELARNLSL